MTYYVYSTLSCDNLYTAWVKGGSDMKQIQAQVAIKGGSNIADKRLHTPLGVVTTVTEEQLAILEQNRDFNLHKANGFITVQKKKVEAEVVVADMVQRDGSAPITPNDYINAKENEPVPSDAKSGGKAGRPKKAV